MRAAQEGSTLKAVITECLLAGLSSPAGPRVVPGLHRRPPPVAIRKNRKLAPAPSLSNQQLNAIMEDEEIKTLRKLTAKRNVRK
jgi:hypothetical protein